MMSINQPAFATKREGSWHWLYKLGSLAAAGSVFIIPLTIAVYLIWR